MRPTLESGDYVIGQREEGLAPMDLVAFRHPQRRDFWLIKRVIALGGRIDLDTGTVDGTPYDDPFREALVEAGVFDIPPGSMFVLSDNRTSTRADSRAFGPVPVVGSFRLRFRYWPNPTHLRPG